MTVSTSTVPAGARATAARRPVAPTALAVDLGSRTVGIWAAHQGTVSGAWSEGRPVRRGRVVDVDGCISTLSELAGRYPQPVPRGGVLVACRPLLASPGDQAVTRQVLDAVFAPARILFIDGVRAAAVGSGAAAGTLLIADVGAELTEVALLEEGRVRAARRTEIGVGDLAGGATVDLISDTVRRHVDELRGGPDAPAVTRASARGMLLVGDGALHPGLAAALSDMVRVRVHQAVAPRTAALTGAGLAAMSLLRHPARG